VTDPQAYALFLQGREVMRQFNPEAIEQAIALYKEALSIDPTYAPAWDGLADGYYNEMDLGIASVDQALPLAVNRRPTLTSNMRARLTRVRAAISAS
jgi:tetratricopeptide (TPR) repeat protein